MTITAEMWTVSHTRKKYVRKRSRRCIVVRRRSPTHDELGISDTMLEKESRSKYRESPSPL